MNEKNRDGAIAFGLVCSAAVIIGGLFLPSSETPDPTNDTMTVSIEGVKDAAPGKQVVLQAKGNAPKYIWVAPSALDGYRGCKGDFVFSCLTPGRYEISCVGVGGSDGVVATHVIEIKGAVPPPVVVVPPNPKPDPVPVVTDQPFRVLLVHEESDDTTDATRAIYNLRSGVAATWLKGQNHTLDILDDDQKDPNGQPSALLAKYAPYKTPEVVVLDKNGAVVDRKQLDTKFTADQVTEIVKRAGGK